MSQTSDRRAMPWRAWTRICVALAVLAGLVSPSRAADAPMTYIEFRFAADWIAPDSFNSVPRKLWRHEDVRLRLEEPRNPDNGVEGLLIANAPDAWVIDRAKKQGRHFVDPGPTFNVVFPVFNTGVPAAFKALQMGREVAFFEAQKGTVRGQDTLEGVACDTYTLADDKTEVKLWVERASRRPLQAALKAEKLAFAVRYLVYKTDVPADPALFRLPEGIAVEQAK